MLNSGNPLENIVAMWLLGRRSSEGCGYRGCESRWETMVARASPYWGVFIFLKDYRSLGGHLVSHSCTDRVSQAPDDPFDSAQGPSCTWPRVSPQSMVNVRTPTRATLTYVCSSLRICHSLKPALSAGGLEIISRGLYVLLSSKEWDKGDTDRCVGSLPPEGAVCSKHPIPFFSTHGVDGLDLQTVNQLSGTELLDGSASYKASLPIPV